MTDLSPTVSLLQALVLGIAGAGLAMLLNLPAGVLVGPALAVAAGALAGLKPGVPDPLRNLVFVVIGLSVGSGFTSDAGAAIGRWPIAFLALGLMLAATMTIGRAILVRWFGYDRQSAVLTAAPGHLSFVLALGQDTGADVARIAVAQTIRVMVLIAVVPFAALALGYQMPATVLPPAAPMPPAPLALLAAAGVLLGLVFRRLRLPAPLLLGPMVVSALSQVTGLTGGGPPAWLLLPAMVTMGALIGSRFSGLTPSMVGNALFAGLTVTALSAGFAALAALPVSAALDMPAAHVLAAFAPGGLEAMIALGATMGASPGFVAASHVVRLMILTVLIPLWAGRRAR